jgi:type IV secretory pathway TraG/TraD family ATPase VirD4
MQRHKYKTYDMSTSWYENSLVREFLIEHSTLIDDLVDRKLIDKVIAEHTAQQNRTRAISFLMTIIFFKIALKNRIN